MTADHVVTRVLFGRAIASAAVQLPSIADDELFELRGITQIQQSRDGPSGPMGFTLTFLNDLMDQAVREFLDPHELRSPHFRNMRTEFTVLGRLKRAFDYDADVVMTVFTMSAEGWGGTIECVVTPKPFVDGWYRAKRTSRAHYFRTAGAQLAVQACLESLEQTVPIAVGPLEPCESMRCLNCRRLLRGSPK